MHKHHFDTLMQTLADRACELAVDGSFQVSSLQRLKTLFRDLEAYREFSLIILSEVQAEVENSGYSPLLPLAEKIGLFEQVRQAIADNDLAQLEIFKQRLFDLQPGWKRVWIHSSRRKGRDRQLILLEYAVKSFIDDKYNEGVFGFQLVCLYLSSLDSVRFRFAADASEKLLKVAAFWKNHPPCFSSPTIKKPETESRTLPVNGLGVELLPTPDAAAAEAAERIKRGELRYQPGDWVMHRYFGRGLIRTVSRSGQNLTASFEYRSDKELSSEYSPMWPIPEPADPHLEPVAPTGIVRQVYEAVRQIGVRH